MRKRITLGTGQVTKAAALTKSNWEYKGRNARTYFYRHKRRKHVGLHVDVQTGLGTFWDERTAKLLSAPKRVQWT